MELDDQTRDALRMVYSKPEEYEAYYVYLHELLEKRDLAREDRLRLGKELSTLQESIGRARAYYSRLRDARRAETQAQAKIPSWLRPFIGEYCYPNPWYSLKPKCRPYVWLAPVNWLGLLHYIINKKGRVLSYGDLASYFQHSPEATGDPITAKSLQNNVASTVERLPLLVREALRAEGYLA